MRVNNVEDSTSSQLRMMNNQITSKVSKGEVYSIVKQSPDAIRYAFNDISGSVTINSSGL